MKRIYLFFVFFSLSMYCQQQKSHFVVDVNFLRGNVLAHSKDLNHLVTGHPEGFMVSFSKKTFGEKEWETTYNYPDYGIYFLYQDFKNEFLGKNVSLGVHYNFYFLHRNLQFKMATGIAVASNPYNKETNSKNNAFGSKLLSNINIGLNYKKSTIIDKFGIEAGLLFTHYSNGRTKSPNSGINTYNLNLGINYAIETESLKLQDTIKRNKSFTEPIKFNFVFRTGFNESSIINSGQFPFYHIGFYLDKRINKKSALQLGTEIFLSQYNKEFIKYQSVAYPDLNLDPNTDYKRAGVFIGHELFINKLSVETQLGFYVYQPYKFDTIIYDRLGIKYHLNKKLFIGISLKTHLFLAEALEFVIGARI